MTLQLTGRSSSHFTRVVRMVAYELGIPLELRVVYDLLSLEDADYGGHPGLKLPALHIGDTLLLGTDNICCKLAEIAGRDRDPRVVLSHQLASDRLRTAQELVWYAMAAHVQLVLGVRFAKLPAENIYFQKAKAGMLGALGSLDRDVVELLRELPTPRDVSVFEVSLFCLVEHIAFCRMLDVSAFGELRTFAEAYARREAAQRMPFRTDAAPAITAV